MRGPDQATRRRLVFGSTLGVAALLAVALVGILNYLAFRHYWRWDWTQSRLYTLSEKSLSILGGLDRDVEVIVLMDEQSEVFAPTKELLARYAAASPRVTVSIVDPVRNQARARQLVEQYDLQRAAVVFESGEERRVVEANELADYDFAAMQMGGEPQLSGFKGEQQFTGAIVELMEAEKPSILFTTGHGEPSLDGMEERGFGRLQRYLGQDNFAIEEWASLGKGEVPAGTDLVVVAGPTAPFSAPELDALGGFVRGGGRVLVLLDPNLSGSQRLADTGLAGWLAGFGVEVGDDLVIDPPNVVPSFSAETFFAMAYGTHPITEALRQGRVPVVLSAARSVRAAAGARPGTVTELVSSSPDGWGERALDELTAVGRDDGDLTGPVALGVAVDLGAKAPELPGMPGEEPPAPPVEAPAGGRLVVFGDADFATNGHLDLPGNATLVVNALNWMIERDTHLGIPPKEPEQVRLSLTSQQRAQVLWLLVLGIPAATLVAGIAITVRRRR
jgi:hypothetical protein